VKFIDCIDKFAHQVPGASDPEMVEALRDAVIEFCKRTTVLTYWTEKTSASLAFDISGAVGLVPVAIFQAYVNGAEADVYELNAQELAEATSDKPILTYRTDRLYDTVTITPAPTTSVPVRLLMSFMPHPDTNEYPDQLWIMRREALKAGALYRLLSAPGTPYVNESAAANWLRVFEDGVSSAATAASVNRRTNRARLRVTPA
jgi:hypothetical protein